MLDPASSAGSAATSTVVWQNPAPPFPRAPAAVGNPYKAPALSQTEAQLCRSRGSAERRQYSIDARRESAPAAPQCRAGPAPETANTTESQSRNSFPETAARQPQR